MAKKQNQTGATNTALIGVIVILLAVMGGMFYYFTQMSATPTVSPTTEQTDTGTTNTNTTASVAPTTTKIQVPEEQIGTEFGSATVKVNSITRNNTGVTVNFTLSCNDGSCKRVVNNPDEADRYGKSDDTTGNYDIYQAYIVDSNSLKKYEVLKDANGKYLATEPFYIAPFLNRESKAMTVTFTNPPAEVKMIDIHIPKVQVISNIAI